MESANALMRAVDNPAIDQVAEPLSEAVRGAYEAAGPIGRQAKNAVHGFWLGHPLHPVFTDAPIGAWTTALALDAAANGDPGMRRAATFAMGVGLTGALGAAVTGLTDWSETGDHPSGGIDPRLAECHRDDALCCRFAIRRKDSHGDGRKCAWTGKQSPLERPISAATSSMDSVSASTTRRRNSQRTSRDLRSAPLADNSMVRARARNTQCCWYASADAYVRSRMRVPILEVLVGGHAQRRLRRLSVAWVEFALEDGRVLNGPATHNQPCLVAREREEQIEVKALS